MVEICGIKILSREQSVTGLVEGLGIASARPIDRPATKMLLQNATVRDSLTAGSS
jgi:hypothetical protein